MSNLILIGGGGHCKSVIDAVNSTGRHILGILEKEDEIGKSIYGINIIGTDEDIPKYVDYAEFLITVGFIKNPNIRIRLFEMIKRAGGSQATIIANSAHVSEYALLGEGTVIMNQAVVNSGAQIGVGCIINTHADIEHDAHIGDFCHISTGAIVNGDCRIGHSTFIGSGAVISNGVSITDNVIVGAGAVVCSDITVKGTYVGIPARKID